jgi:hypothetical protein
MEGPETSDMDLELKNLSPHFITVIVNFCLRVMICCEYLEKFARY